MCISSDATLEFELGGISNSSVMLHLYNRHFLYFLPGNPPAPPQSRVYSAASSESWHDVGVFEGRASFTRLRDAFYIWLATLKIKRHSIIVPMVK